MIELKTILQSRFLSAIYRTATDRLVQTGLPAILFFGILIASAQAQDREVGMPYEQRIQLAHQLMDPIRDQFVKAKTSRQQFPGFLAAYAKLDPEWTARYITEHPLPTDGPYYDYIAIQTLAGKARSLPADDLLKLISNVHYMRSNVAMAALKSVQSENKNLRKRIIEAGLASIANDQPVSPMAFGSRLELARLADNPNVLSEVKTQIAEFYNSGQAEKYRTQAAASRQQAFVDALLDRFDPSLDQKALQHPTESDSYGIEHLILDNMSLSDADKLTRIRALTNYSFASQQHEILTAASLLGRIALLDTKLALQWAEEAPDAASKCWARLVIAPAVFQVDAERGTHLIRDTYQQLGALSLIDNQQAARLAIPPQTVACNGLFIVDALKPELVQECLTTAIALNDRFAGSVAESLRFPAIAAIGRFNPKAARAMYFDNAHDVSIGAAGEFFRALLTIEPQSFFDEYRSLPPEGPDGINWQRQVRTAVLPALVKKSQDQFWYELGKSPLLLIHEEVLDLSKVK